MTWAILVINIKGGTGKSTVAQELTHALDEQGHDVGALDADIDSANLSSRMGVDEKISFSGDHTVKPVEKDGIKLYSMENAFEDASFAQNGKFMREVIDNMVNHSEWGDLDYMVVDCPPGSSDVFEELVRALRANILGAVSVGISDAVEDTARLVKVCDHNWVPIIGFIENMSGMECHGSPVECEGTGSFNSHEVEPFGTGKIKNLAVEMEGATFLGDIPLCVEETSVSEAAGGTLESTVEAIEQAAEEGSPELPEDNIGQKSFISNVWGTIKKGIKQVNQDIPVDKLQDQFGVEGRDPLVVKIELTDASGLTSVLSEVVLTVDDGDIRPMRPSKAKRKGIEVEGGIRLTSQDLYDAIRNEKTVMKSVNGEVTTIPYSIIEAVKMGDAEIWGDRTINRLAVLDRILSDVISMSEVKQVIEQ
jgi:ATP-binding protein involved in chromosome partitioning